MSTSPGLALHCMRLRPLNVDEHMLVSHLTVTAHVISICCSSVPLWKEATRQALIVCRLCGRESVLIPQSSQSVPHSLHLWPWQGAISHTPKTTNQCNVPFTHQAHLYPEFHHTMNSLLATQRFVVTGQCVSGLRNSG